MGASAAPFHAEPGIIFRPQKTLRTAPSFDTIIVPGGSGIREPEVNRAIGEWLKKRASSTRRIAALCTGIYGLASTGLLDHREATTHWRFASDVARQFPKIRVDHRRALVQDGAFYTAAGMTAGIDLSRKLVEEDFGPQVAASLERELAMHFARRTADEQPVEHSHFPDQSTDRFARLVAWMLRNLNEDLSVHALARRACMCPENFGRAFKSVFGATPAAFVENLRLNEARRRLSTRRKTLHSIAESVGYRDATAFGRAFERRFGVRPSALTNARQGGDGSLVQSTGAL